MMNRIKLFVMDVDGTLTDGTLNITNNGDELFKSFNSKDGYALKKLLPEANITPVIITGRASKIVEMRAKELEITEVYQNIENKMDALLDVVRKFGVSVDETAFIGDDLSDLPAMTVCYISGCPADAVEKVKENADFVSSKTGGCGAVREFIDYLLHHK